MGLRLYSDIGKRARDSDIFREWLCGLLPLEIFEISELSNVPYISLVENNEELDRVLLPGRPLTHA